MQNRKQGGNTSLLDFKDAAAENDYVNLQQWV
jgi:hypothetical protein